MLNGHAQCAPKGLEHGFNLVMRIHAAQIVDVQSYLGVIDEALEKLHEQIYVKAADAGTGERHVHLQARAPGKVDHHA